MLIHGGNLREAERLFGVPEAGWLDLSTGISPFAYPISEACLAPELFYRLPQGMDDLKEAARDYYGAQSLTAVCGSQAAIQILPRLRGRSRVAVLSPAYEEHAYRWQLAGHDVVRLGAEEILSEADNFDVVVLVNPNNPTGIFFSPQDLLSALAILQKRDGWLVVDEAFIDTRAEFSLSSYVGEKGLIILRSVGKAFGLAGTRVGFVLAENCLIETIENESGPWPISGSSLSIVTRALGDRLWQKQNFARLDRQSNKLTDLLLRHQVQVSGATSFFVYVQTNGARLIHEQLSQAGIWVRLFAEPSALRFGLPGSDTDFKRLEAALANLKVEALQSPV